MRIELPWPDSNLLPNRRNGRHWSVTQRAKEQAKSDATWATKYALTFQHEQIDPEQRAEVTLMCLPPDNRGRDVDGILSSLKPSLDAIAETLGINDRLFNPIIIYRGDVVDGGKVIVTIDQIPF